MDCSECLSDMFEHGCFGECGKDIKDVIREVLKSCRSEEKDLVKSLEKIGFKPLHDNEEFPCEFLSDRADYYLVVLGDLDTWRFYEQIVYESY